MEIERSNELALARMALGNSTNRAEWHTDYNPVRQPRMEFADERAFRILR
jgi:hypothetical protein